MINVENKFDSNGFTLMGYGAKKDRELFDYLYPFTL